MQIELNDTTFTLPTTLQEFTLGQRIAFQQQHGNILDEMVKSILAMEDPFEQELETMTLQLEKAYRTFSFFSGVPVDVIKNSEQVGYIVNLYFSSMALLFESEEAITLQQTFYWQGEIWQLAKPELKQGDNMSFGEVIDAKQQVQNMHDLGLSHWEAMLPLCAIFFRKKDEPYEESFIYEDSDRMKLMLQLPMEYALQVGFFLNACLNFYIQTSRSSMQAG